MVFQGLKISGADVLVLHVGIQRLMDCRSLIVNKSALGASAFQLIQDGDRSQLRSRTLSEELADAASGHAGRDVNFPGAC